MYPINARTRRLPAILHVGVSNDDVRFVPISPPVFVVSFHFPDGFA